MTETMTLGAARARYFEANGFASDGGDSLAWVPVKVLGLTLKIPNTEGRRRAVRIHDLHHVLTGFHANLAGESEIAAWELASGCLRWPAATVLNLFALAIGLVIAPRRVARAWALGRTTRNLYGEDGVDHLLPCGIDETRAALGLGGAPPRVQLRHVLAITALGLPVLALMISIVVAPLVGIIAGIAALI